ncbi:protein transport protein Sec16A isoform X2 [Nematostella vectensis]|uniref:protein transport protein Sec16A isoform X2 n=1 Tax=Nematostella vectensis TaxID=45351 RepID=UPI0020777178|nr:protein transport protein Sec16A isoform X2 [Nematostella vectensis]
MFSFFKKTLNFTANVVSGGLWEEYKDPIQREGRPWLQDVPKMEPYPSRAYQDSPLATPFYEDQPLHHEPELMEQEDGWDEWPEWEENEEDSWTGEFQGNNTQQRQSNGHFTPLENSYQPVELFAPNSPPKPQQNQPKPPKPSNKTVKQAAQTPSKPSFLWDAPTPASAPPASASPKAQSTQGMSSGTSEQPWFSPANTVTAFGAKLASSLFGPITNENSLFGGAQPTQLFGQPTKVDTVNLAHGQDQRRQGQHFTPPLTNQQHVPATSDPKGFFDQQGSQASERTGTAPPKSTANFFNSLPQQSSRAGFFGEEKSHTPSVSVPPPAPKSFFGQSEKDRHIVNGKTASEESAASFFGPTSKLGSEGTVNKPAKTAADFFNQVHDMQSGASIFGGDEKPSKTPPPTNSKGFNPLFSQHASQARPKSANFFNQVGGSKQGADFFGGEEVEPAKAGGTGHLFAKKANAQKPSTQQVEKTAPVSTHSNQEIVEEPEESDNDVPPLEEAELEPGVPTLFPAGGDSAVGASWDQQPAAPSASYPGADTTVPTPWDKHSSAPAEFHQVSNTNTPWEDQSTAPVESGLAAPWDEQPSAYTGSHPVENTVAAPWEDQSAASVESHPVADSAVGAGWDEQTTSPPKSLPDKQSTTTIESHPVVDSIMAAPWDEQTTSSAESHPVVDSIMAAPWDEQTTSSAESHPVVDSIMAAPWDEQTTSSAESHPVVDSIMAAPWDHEAGNMSHPVRDTTITAHGYQEPNEPTVSHTISNAAMAAPWGQQPANAPLEFPPSSEEEHDGLAATESGVDASSGFWDEESADELDVDASSSSSQNPFSQQATFNPVTSSAVLEAFAPTVSSIDPSPTFTDEPTLEHTPAAAATEPAPSITEESSADDKVDKEPVTYAESVVSEEPSLAASIQPMVEPAFPAEEPAPQVPPPVPHEVPTAGGPVSDQDEWPPLMPAGTTVDQRNLLPKEGPKGTPFEATGTVPFSWASVSTPPVGFPPKQVKTSAWDVADNLDPFNQVAAPPQRSAPPAAPTPQVTPHPATLPVTLFTPQAAPVTPPMGAQLPETEQPQMVAPSSTVTPPVTEPAPPSSVVAPPPAVPTPATAPPPVVAPPPSVFASSSGVPTPVKAPPPSVFASSSGVPTPVAAPPPAPPPSVFAPSSGVPTPVAAPPPSVFAPSSGVPTPVAAPPPSVFASSSGVPTPVTAPPPAPPPSVFAPSSGVPTPVAAPPPSVFAPSSGVPTPVAAPPPSVFAPSSGVPTPVTAPPPAPPPSVFAPSSAVPTPVTAPPPAPPPSVFAPSSGVPTPVTAPPPASPPSVFAPSSGVPTPVTAPPAVAATLSAPPPLVFAPPTAVPTSRTVPVAAPPSAPPPSVSAPPTDVLPPAPPPSVLAPPTAVPMSRTAPTQVAAPQPSMFAQSSPVPPPVLAAPLSMAAPQLSAPPVAAPPPVTAPTSATAPPLAAVQLPVAAPPLATALSVVQSPTVSRPSVAVPQPVTALPRTPHMGKTEPPTAWATPLQHSTAEQFEGSVQSNVKKEEEIPPPEAGLLAKATQKMKAEHRRTPVSMSSLWANGNAAPSSSFLLAPAVTKPVPAVNLFSPVSSPKIAGSILSPFTPSAAPHTNHPVSASTAQQDTASLFSQPAALPTGVAPMHGKRTSVEAPSGSDQNRGLHSVGYNEAATPVNTPNAFTPSKGNQPLGNSSTKGQEGYTQHGQQDNAITPLYTGSPNQYYTPPAATPARSAHADAMTAAPSSATGEHTSIPSTSEPPLTAKEQRKKERQEKRERKEKKKAEKAAEKLAAATPSEEPLSHHPVAEQRSAYHRPEFPGNPHSGNPNSDIYPGNPLSGNSLPGNPHHVDHSDKLGMAPRSGHLDHPLSPKHGSYTPERSKEYYGQPGDHPPTEEMRTSSLSNQYSNYSRDYPNPESQYDPQRRGDFEGDRFDRSPDYDSHRRSSNPRDYYETRRDYPDDMDRSRSRDYDYRYDRRDYSGYHSDGSYTDPYYHTQDRGYDRSRRGAYEQGLGHNLRHSREDLFHDDLQRSREDLYYPDHRRTSSEDRSAFKLVDYGHRLSRGSSRSRSPNSSSGRSSPSRQFYHDPYSYYYQGYGMPSPYNYPGYYPPDYYQRYYEEYYRQMGYGSAPGSQYSGEGSGHIEKETREPSPTTQEEPVEVEEIPPSRLTPLHFPRPHVRGCFTLSGQLLVIPPVLPGDGVPAYIQNAQIKSAVFSQEDLLLIEEFPGPLIGRDSIRNIVMEYIREQTNKIKNTSTCGPSSQARWVIWQLMYLLVKHCGAIVTADIAEALMTLVKLFAKKPLQQAPRALPEAPSDEESSDSEDSEDESSTETSSEESSDDSISPPKPAKAAKPPKAPKERKARKQAEPPVPPESPEPTPEMGHLMVFRDLMLEGQKKEALTYASNHDMWGHAILASALLDHRATKSLLQTQTSSWVCTKFLGTIDNDDPLHTVYEHLGGQTPHLLSSSKNWASNLAAIVANPTHNREKDMANIITLGDTLAKEPDLVCAAHVCYILAGLKPGPPGTKTKMVLLGTRHETNQYHKLASVEPLLLTEVFEYARGLQTRDFYLPSIQMFKFFYAKNLLEAGMVRKAFDYLQCIGDVIVHNPHAFNHGLMKNVYETSDQILGQLESAGESVETHDREWITRLGQVMNGETPTDLSLPELEESQDPLAESSQSFFSGYDPARGGNTGSTYQSSLPEVQDQFSNDSEPSETSGLGSTHGTPRKETHDQSGNVGGGITQEPCFTKTEPPAPPSNYWSPPMQPMQQPDQEQPTPQDMSQPQDMGYPESQPQHMGYPESRQQDMGYPESQPQDMGYPESQYEQHQQQPFAVQGDQSYWQPPQPGFRNADRAAEEEEGETTPTNPPNTFDDFYNQSHQKVARTASWDDPAMTPTPATQEMNRDEMFPPMPPPQPPQARQEPTNKPSEDKPGGKDKSKPPSNGSGWFSGIGSLIKKVIPSGPNEMKLPDDRKKTIYFDKELNRWVNTEEDSKEQAPPPPPPSDAMMQGMGAPSMSEPPAGGPPMGQGPPRPPTNPTAAPMGQPPSMTSALSSNGPSIPDNQRAGSGTPPGVGPAPMPGLPPMPRPATELPVMRTSGPPSKFSRKATGRLGRNKMYVDVLNPNKGSGTQSTAAPAALFPLLPGGGGGVAGGVQFFVPSAAPPTEESNPESNELQNGTQAQEAPSNSFDNSTTEPTPTHSRSSSIGSSISLASAEVRSYFEPQPDTAPSLDSTDSNPQAPPFFNPASFTPQSKAPSFRRGRGRPYPGGGYR